MDHPCNGNRLLNYGERERNRSIYYYHIRYMCSRILFISGEEAGDNYLHHLPLPRSTSCYSDVLDNMALLFICIYLYMYTILLYCTTISYYHFGGGANHSSESSIVAYSR